MTTSLSPISCPGPRRTFTAKGAAPPAPEPNALTGVYRFVHEPSRILKIVHSPSATGKVVK